MSLLTLHSDVFYGTLIKRYKRFLADIQLDSGPLITAHCPNPGRMLSCSEPGSRVRLSHFDDAKRKYPYRLDLVHNGHCWIGVNPNLANAIVEAAIHAGVLFPGFDQTGWQREVKYAQSHRIDFLHTDHVKTYVEVKSVTYARDGVGYFPDAVSKRATAHLTALQDMVKCGHRAVVVYCIQRSDIQQVEPAAHIDSAYAKQFKISTANGVEMMTLPVQFDPAGLKVCLVE